MADKGFNIKVLVPTEDGFTISEQGIENAPYYLCYNISNRSYQLAEKHKAREIFNDKSENVTAINDIVIKLKIDFILCKTENNAVRCGFIKPQTNEINKMLNILIDMVDQKKELLFFNQ
ncbi:MAG TPA: hypothetical protein DCG75_18095 [Bacteroidales bacterium]|jgi:hypothetical protein|nr:hypothetical protein [Bacteroidales bacterium]